MLKIFNTLSSKKEEFSLNFKSNVNIYVCGITPSDFMHIGHARTFIIFDMIIRYLKHIGYKTYYVRNITDISKKILNKAILNKLEYSVYIEKIKQDINKNIKDLNILKPTYEVNISKLVPESILLINKLLEKNYAYIAPGGDIRFFIRKFSEYGDLSKQKINKLSSIINQKRLDIDKDYNFDFVLWKKLIDNKEMTTWSSPWGTGYPGWHTGCFTIINEYFYKKDRVLDIHGGGHDLIFPHHENELAQYKTLYKKSFVKFWIHVGLVLINNKKMSKSKNNFFYVKNIFTNYNPEILRAFFFTSHYRKNINFSLNALNSTKQWLEKLYLTIRKIKRDFVIESDFEKKYEKYFFKAMNNDFNTVESYSILLDMAQKINFFYVKNKKGFANCLSIKLIKLANILGLLTQKPESFLQNRTYKFENFDYIENLIDLRNEARKNKNWVLADNIRKKLKKYNILLEDDRDGTKWRKT